MNDFASTVMQNHEDVQPGESDRVDGEEVDRPGGIDERTLGYGCQGASGLVATSAATGTAIWAWRIAK